MVSNSTAPFFFSRKSEAVVKFSWIKYASQCDWDMVFRYNGWMKVGHICPSIHRTVLWIVRQCGFCRFLLGSRVAPQREAHCHEGGQTWVDREGLGTRPGRRRMVRQEGACTHNPVALCVSSFWEIDCSAPKQGPPADSWEKAGAWQPLTAADSQPWKIGKP